MERRRDIDGLRAVAVLAIVGFHAAPGLVPGGFVGVDVFFVISGFLITGILARERDAKTFSFGRFYLRRARRMLPAYLVVTAVTAMLAYWLFLPDELKTFGWALGASGLFLVNFVFAKYPGYFEVQSEQSPLLHLWSLSVEEQFYLVWPLLILVLSLAPVKRFRLWLAGLLLLASLAGAQAVLSSDARLAFFHLPFRAWEFLLGGLLALGVPSARNRAAAEVATGVGLALIVGSAFVLNRGTAFPGLAALPACLGAALAIWGGEGSRVAAVPLRTAPVAAVGLVSYSLYLWHWPLLVFARLLNEGPLAADQVLFVISASGLLAFLTWRYVEQPWRRYAEKPNWRQLAYGAAPLAAVLFAGLLPLNLNGLPGRLPKPVLTAAAQETEDVNPNREACFGKGSKLGRTPEVCRTGGPPQVLVWGDSHADAITPGVQAWAARRGYGVQESANGGCPPLADVKIAVGPREVNLGCGDFNAAVLREIAAAKELKLILLVARWPIYADVQPSYDVNSGRVTMRDARGGGPLPLDVGLDRTLAAIAATGTTAKVVVFAPWPELPQVVPRCVARKRLLGQDERVCLDAPADLPLARIAAVQGDLDAAVAKHPGVAQFKPAQWLCHDGRCNASFAGKSIYFDDDHLAASAAEWLVPRWIDRALVAPSPPGA